jgi:hypothetical protein
MLKNTILQQTSILIISSFLSVSSATKNTFLDIPDDLMERATLQHKMTAEINARLLETVHKDRANYIQKHKDHYLENQETFKALLATNLEKLGNQDAFLKFFGDVREFIVNGAPISREKQEKMVDYILQAQFDQFSKPFSATAGVSASSLNQIDFLQHVLSLNGEGSSLMVVENAPFTPHPSVRWFDSLALLSSKGNSHGLKTSGVCASTSATSPGVAGDATVIPVLYHHSVSLQYEKLLEERSQLEASYLLAFADITEHQRMESLAVAEGKRFSETLLARAALSPKHTAEKEKKLSEWEQDITHPLYRYTSKIQAIQDNEKLRNYVVEKRKRSGLTHMDIEYGNFVPSLRLALEDAHLYMDPKKTVFPHVINMSVSHNIDTFSDENLLALKDLLVDNDMILVVASGNEGGAPMPLNLSEVFKKQPEIQRRIIFVGATDHLRDIASFSNLPGESCANDFIFTQGTKITVLSHETTEGFSEDAGTSYSAPIVSGTLTLLKKYFPHMSMPELKDVILSTTTPFPAYTEKTDPSITGRGQLDAFQAFAKALSGSRPPVVIKENSLLEKLEAFQAFARNTLEEIAHKILPTKLNAVQVFLKDLFKSDSKKNRKRAYLDSFS